MTYTVDVKDLVLLADRDTSAFRHRELDAAVQLLPSHLRARWVPTDRAEISGVSGADGVWVVSGSPYRDEGAVYNAVSSARTSGQPLLGTCAGFQYVVVELARNVAGIGDADHPRFLRRPLITVAFFLSRCEIRGIAFRTAVDIH